MTSIRESSACGEGQRIDEVGACVRRSAGKLFAQINLKMFANIVTDAVGLVIAPRYINYFIKGFHEF